MIIESNDKYMIMFFESLNKYSLTLFRYNNNKNIQIFFNSLINLKLVLAVLLKDVKEYGDYIFLQKDFDSFLAEI